MKTRTRLTLTIAACGTLAGVAALAGPLDPPAGPVAPITQGGGYYLTGNIQGEPSKDGILIATSTDVTIDLNGYTMFGGAGPLRGINNPAASSSAAAPSPTPGRTSSSSQGPVAGRAPDIA